MQKPPQARNLIDRNQNLTSEWSTWITVLWAVTDSIDGAGTTANRPIANLFVGRQYFDTTLGKPIWLKSIRPNVWVDATGAAV